MKFDMANRKKGMETIRQLISMHLKGDSRRQMAEHLSISRNTVKKYLFLLQQSGIDYEVLSQKSEAELKQLLERPVDPEADRLARLQARFPQMEKELKRVGVTRWTLWEEYCLEAPDGYSYGRFCHHFQQWRKFSEVSIPQEHKAGEKLFVDFAGKKLKLVDPQTGEEQEVEVFVATLGASQLMYVEAVASQKKEDFLTALANSLSYFDGVPGAIVPDNLKSAVTQSDKYEPELNPDMAAFARYYNTAILPARAYRPKDKALAELAVKLTYRRIYAPLRNRTFHSLRELNQAIAIELEKHNAKHFQHRDYSRRDLFEQVEREALEPLPPNPWEPKAHRKATVYKNSHIWFGIDKHYYSVPYQYLGKKVDVFYSADQVEIYHNHERIAFHVRNRKQYTYSTTPEHMPSANNYRAEWNPDRFIRWAEKIGPHTKVLITLLLNGKTHPEQAYKSCMGILTMAGKKDIGPQRLELACHRALDFNQHNYRFVKNTLHHKMESVEPENRTESQYQLPFHDNIRGENYYQ